MLKNTTEVPENLRIKLAKYLNELKDKRKLGFNQLSIKSEVNPGVLTKILSGSNKRVNPYQLKKLAYALRVDYKELYKIVGYLDEEDFGSSETTLKEESNIEVIDGEYIRVPIYDSVSAGIGKVPNPEPLDFLSLPLAIGKGCVGITVDGDSMETTINNGSVVLVKKDVEVGQNDIGVFLYEDEAIVKRYKCIENKCYLISDNKEYPAREIREEDDFKVCGKVVWILNKA